MKSNSSDHPTKPERTTTNSFRRLLAAFASDTSFGGVSKVASSNGAFRRIIWALISSTCYGFTIYMCYRMVETYLQRPISTSIDMVYEKNIDFPALTICNLNKFRQSQLHKIKSINKMLQEFRRRNKSVASDFENTITRQKKLLKKDVAASSDLDSDVDDDDVDITTILAQMIAIEASRSKIQSLSSIGYNLKDMLVSCSWMGVDCKGGYFAKFWINSWNWKYGNCFTFNPGVDSNGSSVRILRTSMPGPNFGLTIDMNIDQEDYISELSDEAGLKIVLHNAREMAFPYDEGITIPPGFSSSVAIRKEIIQRVDPFNNGSCNAVDTLSSTNIYTDSTASVGRKYSVKACMKSCLAREQLTKCNCTAVQFSHYTDFNVCETDEEGDCMAEVNGKYKQGKIGCSNQCPEPCYYSSYSHSFMLSALSTNKKKNAKKGIGSNKTDDDVTDNYLRLKIYYEQLNLQMIVQSTSYNLESLLGDIGGQLGLWIGICVISVAEFGELIISMFIVAFQKYRGRKNSKVKQQIEMS